MTASTTATAPKQRDPRTGLRNTAASATVLTILGLTVLGFEQPVSMVVVALITGYSCELLFEWIDATTNGRPPRFRGGGFVGVVDFLLSAHMTSITMSFLIYTNDRLGAMAFAVAAAIASKYLFRVIIDGKPQHFMNPSNFGIALTFVLFPWVATMPYLFTENVTGIWDVAVPLVFVTLGLRVNILFTGRMPLIVSWLLAFVAQAVVRWAFFDDINLVSALAPMTGAAFILVTFFMITDPRTSPSSFRGQVAFGLAIGAAYGVIIGYHITFTLFFAVTAVCSLRGLLLYASAWQRAEVPQTVPVAALEKS
jgi:hypothetical protein